jgi:hypothetical protein
MTDIVAQMTLAGVPVNGLADDPEITILRLDTDVAVVTSAAMVDQGGNGLYKFAFTAGVAGVAYSFAIDADPSVTGQVGIRTLGGAFNNEVRDIWRDRGLDPAAAKTVDDNGVADDADIDEDVAAGSGPAIHKDVLTVGTATTVQRS